MPKPTPGAHAGFAAACGDRGVDRLIYLGGLGEESQLSAHLRSRREVERLLTLAIAFPAMSHSRWRHIGVRTPPVARHCRPSRKRPTADPPHLDGRDTACIDTASL